MSLPLRLPWERAQDRWAAELQPILNFPPVQGLLLKNVSLKTGTNVISHKLGRSLQGWIPTRVRASASFYDAQDTNQTPALTLVLVSSADVIVDLWVY